MKDVKQFGLIGKNIEYSFSKHYFTEKFKSNTDFSGFTYENFDIKSIRHINTLFINKNLAGLNVTIPYKESVINYLDDLSEEAKEIGAVNTICFEDNKKIGYNTDIYGFTETLKADVKNNFDEVIILGSGGASKTVKYYCIKNQIPFIIVSRKTDDSYVSYQDLEIDTFKGKKLVVNCTPLGTFPNVNKCPEIPYEQLNEKDILFDLVYNPSETLFMKMGKEKGCRTINGYEMLKSQAKRSFELWLDHIK